MTFLLFPVTPNVVRVVKRKGKKKERTHSSECIYAGTAASTSSENKAGTARKGKEGKGGGKSDSAASAPRLLCAYLERVKRGRPRQQRKRGNKEHPSRKRGKGEGHSSRSRVKPSFTSTDFNNHRRMKVGGIVRKRKKEKKKGKGTTKKGVIQRGIIPLSPSSYTHFNSGFPALIVILASGQVYFKGKEKKRGRKKGRGEARPPPRHGPAASSSIHSYSIGPVLVDSLFPISHTKTKNLGKEKKREGRGGRGGAIALVFVTSTPRVSL